jgi:tellurite resistance protein TerC
MIDKVPLEGWIIFNVVILGLLLLDLGVLNRNSHEVKMREALMWTAGWITLALLFCAGIWLKMENGQTRALEFITGYLIEYALSVDNIFVFVLIFSYFKVAPQYQHKVLFWGIMGALIMRAVMILVGVQLVERFEWLIYVFGVFLIFTGIKLALQKEGDIEPHENPLVRGFRKMMPVTEDYEGDKFFVMREDQNGSLKRWATPLFIVLLMVESTDLIFAIDSIPAIIGVSRDPFIIYTSNVFAILGLRSLYFALAGLMGLFHYLKLGLSIILMFVGIKMLLSHSDYKIPIGLSLGFIVAVLAISVVLSIMRPRHDLDSAEEMLAQAGLLQAEEQGDKTDDKSA